MVSYRLLLLLGVLWTEMSTPFLCFSIYYTAGVVNTLYGTCHLGSWPQLMFEQQCALLFKCVTTQGSYWSQREL